MRTLAYSPGMPAPRTTHALLTLLVAVGIAACGSSRASQPPGGTPSPASTPQPGAATPPGTNTPPIPTSAPTGPAGTRVPLQRLSLTAEAFSQLDGAAISMTAPNDGSGRLFVGNQAGQIWTVYRDGSVEPQPLADLESRIRSGGEQGLLGIAIHPAFPTDPRIFVDFTNRNGDTVIASLDVRGDAPSQVDMSSYRQLLLIDQPYPNHNGGSLQFGHDGYLTIAMGDGGSGGDPHGNGQNPEVLLGKILRIDVDGATGSKPYGIPDENPLAADGGAPEVWISGMRNPWRTSFDRDTGDFWIGDVGQGAWEEVDVVRLATRGPVNFGWNVTEGPDCYRASSCDRDGLTDPVTAYGRDLGCAIVGGYVYRGSAYPVLVGTYLFSDNCTSLLFAIDASSDGPSVPVQVGRVEGSVASFGEDDRGELYVLTLEGAVLKLAATQR